MASYTAAALAAQISASQAAPATAPVPVADKIPASMAKFVDVEAELPVTSVQLDALVVMKIIKHSREATGNASGLLLGLDLDGTLEVSNSFALPPSTDGEDKSIKTSGGKYETLMLRVLKDAQFDDSVVGFYQTTSMGAFLRQSLISTQATQQTTLRQGGIAIVHDLSLTARGSASLRAFRLTKEFIAANKAKTFNSQSLIDNQLTFSRILEELPLVVRSSPLLSSFLSSLTSSAELAQATSSNSAAPPFALLPSFTHLDGAQPASLTRNMDALLETLDAHKTEENNVAFHARQIARERARADAYVQKRNEDNAVRVAQGLAPLPEEDVARLFKIPAEPSRLESTLLLGQVDGYAKSLENASAAALVKLYAAQA